MTEYRAIYAVRIDAVWSLARRAPVEDLGAAAIAMFGRGRIVWVRLETGGLLGALGDEEQQVLLELIKEGAPS